MGLEPLALFLFLGACLSLRSASSPLFHVRLRPSNFETDRRLECNRRVIATDFLTLSSPPAFIPHLPASCLFLRDLPYHPLLNTQVSRGSTIGFTRRSGGNTSQNGKSVSGGKLSLCMRFSARYYCHHGPKPFPSVSAPSAAHCLSQK